ncbi:hypothetical protein VdG1_01931 [Verticillium dahliae VDG1]|nr:hypothetical protein VdG1_01931 [Verticillium dahliae VDG1]
MASLQFTIADIFSQTPYQGNPLAIVDTTSQVLTTTQQQLITRQFNLSETSFILPATEGKADYRLRSFLPDGREVYGAGHNILGVWWYLAESGLLNFTSANLSQTHKDGSETFLFHQELGGEAPPKVHGIHPNRTLLAESFGLTEADIGFTAGNSGSLLPPQVTSTSTTHHLLVPLASVEALNKAVVQKDKLLEQLALVDKRAYGLFLFTRKGANKYEARFFSPGMSGEDPATGSAAGPLSVYLHEHGELELVDGAAHIEVHQGLRVGRRCLIKVALSLEKSEGEDIRQVDLIGGGVTIAEGRISVPGESIAF